MKQKIEENPEEHHHRSRVMEISPKGKKEYSQAETEHNKKCDDV